MERLTIAGLPGVCEQASTEYCREHKDCYQCGHGRKVFKRLAAYEDTGITPEEITHWKACMNTQISKHVFEMAERIEAERDSLKSELAQYKQDITDGRMLPEGYCCVPLSDGKTLGIYHAPDKIVMSEATYYIYPSDKAREVALGIPSQGEAEAALEAAGKE